MRHLRAPPVLRRGPPQVFKFVTGLTAIPVTRPGAAKPFQLLIDGNGTDINLPSASALLSHCPAYPTGVYEKARAGHPRNPLRRNGSAQPRAVPSPP